MRRMVLSAAALFVCACGQQTQSLSAPEAPPGCGHSATHQVVWTNPDHPDIISVRSEGPSCAQAVVTFVARNREGDPLWQFISTYHQMTAGGALPPEAPAVSPLEVDRFLAGWANVTPETSSQLPEWREGVAHLASNGGLTYTTSFGRDAYEAMRQRNLRMICYAAGVDATQCLLVDPSTNAPAMIVAYGP